MRQLYGNAWAPPARSNPSITGVLVILFILTAGLYLIYVTTASPPASAEKVLQAERPADFRSGRTTEIPVHSLEYVLSHLDAAVSLISQANEKAKRVQTRVREVAPFTRKYYLENQHVRLIDADNKSEDVLRLTAGAAEEIESAKTILNERRKSK